jgi:hypothetical protein
MASPELEHLWEDRRNWKWIGVYHCPADPRLIVRKRVRWMGWTLNFAHSSAWLVLLLCIAIAVGPVLLAEKLGRSDPVTLALALASSILLLCLIATWESERYR